MVLTNNSSFNLQRFSNQFSKQVHSYNDTVRYNDVFSIPYLLNFTIRLNVLLTEPLTVKFFRSQRSSSNFVPLRKLVIFSCDA